MKKSVTLTDEQRAELKRQGQGSMYQGTRQLTRVMMAKLAKKVKP